ncbi:MAG TPA: hypothetical protein VFW11_20190 [Cyclobacteriaceae bacterium]|nr:hypothetical protein [Cyclobacteriaceae bacterium]
MARNSFLFVYLFVLSGYIAAAQHPLIGTWEMVSIEGVNAEGEKFKLDSTTTGEAKIITPTHYILIAMDKEDGKWTFNRSYFGKIKIDGSKYVEIPMMSSEPIYENVKTDFDWKIRGNEFIQSGFITRPDGKTVILDKFLFRRSGIPPLSDQKFVGTWQAEHAGVKSFFILTPTHWMVIEKQLEKFSKALGGVYTVKGNLAELSVLYGTENDKSMTAELKGQHIIFNNLSYSKLNSEGD